MARRPLWISFGAAALVCIGIGCSGAVCATTRDCARGFVCSDGACVQASVRDAGVLDGGQTDGGLVDGGAPDGGQRDGGQTDGGDGDAGLPDAGQMCNPACTGSQVCDSSTWTCVTPAEATLRMTEINVASTSLDLIELAAITGGSLDGIQVNELTNSSFSFTFPPGYTVSPGAVIVLHLGGSCTDPVGNPASCTGGMFTPGAWDFSMQGSLSYSGKVFEVLGADGTPMDGAGFVKSAGTMPDTYVGAVQQLQSDGVWDPTVCDTTDFCRNISVDWDGLSSDGSDSVERTLGPDPLAVPGNTNQWTLVGPSTWGSYPDAGQSGSDGGLPSDGGVTITVDEWNLEWFGDTDPSLGPTDDDLQQQNVTEVLADAGADLIGVEEVVDETRFAQVVTALPNHAYVLATDPSVVNGSSYGGAQQVGVIYDQSLFTLDSAQLILGSDADDFAGRPPLEVALTLHTGPSSAVPLYVIVVHMKAGADDSSYGRRQNAANELKSYLDANHPGDRVMVIGDWNDDLDESIDCPSSCDASPYANFLGDGSNYEFPTQLFDTNGWATETDYPTAIDHHLITNELFGNLVPGSPIVLRPDAYIPNYGTTTSDHYPTSVRYHFP